MKCPNCKIEMKEKFAGEGDEGETPCSFICFNQKCKFLGIERINEEWFEDIE